MRGEKKNNSFEIHVIILKYIKNVNLPSKKDFKFAEFLTKTSSSLYFRERPENGKGNKQKRRRKYVRKSKPCMHQERCRKLKLM